MRFHVLCLPHTELTEADLACAYTQKIVKFVKMMTMRGHEVITYGGKQPPLHATEHVHIVDIPEHDTGLLYNVDWANDFHEYNAKAIPALAERASGQDFLCITAGVAHKPVADAFPDLMAVETGIGYSGTFTNFRVFESYAWMHTVYAQQGSDNGRWYDIVIPNYFDVEDFPYDPPAKADEYLFWMGRFIERKGAHIAYEIAQATGRKLIMAGQGVLERTGDKIIGGELSIEGDGYEHIGPVNAGKRALLMRHAHGLMMPTTYIEPFGGVSVEALMAGCPVLATDWGAFPEFIVNYENGFRFHTLKEAIRAVGWFDQLDRERIQEKARQHFSLQSVGRLYEDYFERLSDLWGKGWYAT